jgi:hypothetical protein
MPMVPKCDGCGDLPTGKWYRLSVLDQKPDKRDGCKLAEIDYREDYILCPKCRGEIMEVLNNG